MGVLHITDEATIFQRIQERKGGNQSSGNFVFYELVMNPALAVE